MNACFGARRTLPRAVLRIYVVQRRTWAGRLFVASVVAVSVHAASGECAAQTSSSSAARARPDPSVAWGVVGWGFVGAAVGAATCASSVELGSLATTGRDAPARTLVYSATFCGALAAPLFGGLSVRWLDWMRDVNGVPIAVGVAAGAIAWGATAIFESALRPTGLEGAAIGGSSAVLLAISGAAITAAILSLPRGR